MNNETKGKLFPLLLSVSIIILDQVTKFLIISSIPPRTVGWSFGGDFLRIIHARNLGIAFSMGHGIVPWFRMILFIVIPLVILIVVLIYYLKSNEFHGIQRWAIGGILGGGFGNLIDRVLRPQGVVDFIDVKFYGLFGLERWPAFNVADATIVVSGTILVLAYIISEHKKQRKMKEVEEKQ